MMTERNKIERGDKPEAAYGLTQRGYPRNPMGVIALFVFLIEVVATVSLKLLVGVDSPFVGHVVLFIISFPSVLVLLFFFTLWLRRESLYSPSDFREDSNFMQLFERVDARVDMVEIRQRAAQLDPRGDPSDVFALIPELLSRGDIETIVTLGRAFLKVKRYSQSLEVFQLLSRRPLSSDTQSQVRAFAAYSLNGLGLYEDALEVLTKLRRSDSSFAEKFWPALACSYSHFKLGRNAEFSLWLGKAAARAGAVDYLELAAQLYPELRQHLVESLSSQKESAR
jgi:tetratricopeptide (TPR) repeat protein